MLAIAALVAGLIGAGCGSTDDSPPEAEQVAARADSLLRVLIPPQKQVGARFNEWLEEQLGAIRNDTLTPELVTSVINWHRAEVSDVAQIEGYTTFPLVQRSYFELGLDSVLMLTVTELNKQPRIAQLVCFFPQHRYGVVFMGSLQEKFTEVVRASSGFASPQHFQKSCIRFMQLANLDAQVLLTTQTEWQLLYVADSLLRKAPGSSRLHVLAEEFDEYARVNPSNGGLDTTTAGSSFLNYLNERHQGWNLLGERFSVFNTVPSLRNGIYRSQLDFLDMFSLQARRIVFYYEPEKGFWTTIAELMPAQRFRARPPTNEAGA